MLPAERLHASPPPSSSQDASASRRRHQRTPGALAYQQQQRQQRPVYYDRDDCDDDAARQRRRRVISSSSGDDVDVSSGLAVATTSLRSSSSSEIYDPRSHEAQVEAARAAARAVRDRAAAAAVPLFEDLKDLARMAMDEFGISSGGSFLTAAAAATATHSNTASDRIATAAPVIAPSLTGNTIPAPPRRPPPSHFYSKAVLDERDLGAERYNAEAAAHNPFYLSQCFRALSDDEFFVLVRQRLSHAAAEHDPYRNALRCQLGDCRAPMHATRTDSELRQWHRCAYCSRALFCPDCVRRWSGGDAVSNQRGVRSMPCRHCEPDMRLVQLPARIRDALAAEFAAHPELYAVDRLGVALQALFAHALRQGPSAPPPPPLHAKQRSDAAAAATSTVTSSSSSALTPPLRSIEVFAPPSAPALRRPLPHQQPPPQRQKPKAKPPSSRPPLSKKRPAFSGSSGKSSAFDASRQKPRHARSPPHRTQSKSAAAAAAAPADSMWRHRRM